MSSADVPCGHCYQCRMTAFNDLFLRTRAEYRSCIANGGLSLFLTYTYSEDNVPYMSYSVDEDGIVCLKRVPRHYLGDNVLMTFDKSHQTNYFKNVRRFFDYWFKSKSSFRYISVGEYGSQRTQRPHYHSIFFLDNYLSRCLYGLAKAMKFSWKYDDFFSDRFNLVHSALLTAGSCQPVQSPNFESFLVDFFSYFWSYGIVSASDKGLFVNSDTCASYVSKYVCKNLDLLNYSRFRHFLDYLTLYFDAGALTCPAGHDFKKPLSFFLYYVKFFECAFYTVKSLGFGLSLLDDLQTSDIDELLSILDRGLSVARRGLLSYLPYPRYIQRKLFYCNRSDGSYYPSPLGIASLSRRLSSRLDSFVRYVKDFDFSVLDTLSPDPFRSLGFGVDSRYSLSEYFKSDISYLIRYPLIVFVYSFFLRGRVFPDYNYLTISQSFAELSSGRISLDQFFSLVLPLLYSTDYSSDPLPDDSPRLSDVFVEFPKLSPRFIEFKDYSLDYIVKFWSVFVNYCNFTMLKQYDELNKASKLFTDLLNLNKYGFSKNCS